MKNTWRPSYKILIHKTNSTNLPIHLHGFDGNEFEGKG